jgi:hypothetical protein
MEMAFQLIVYAAKFQEVPRRARRHTDRRRVASRVQAPRENRMMPWRLAVTQ